MYEQTNYLAVGAFILLGAITLFVTGLWVSGVGRTVPMSKYTIIFERDVNGLSEGSPVRYMGVDVGQVSMIRLSHTAGSAVEVQVEVASSTPVDSGTYASLGYQGITGVAFINFAAETGEHEQLTATAGQAYPVIQTRDVGIAALLNSGPEVVGRINSVLDDAGIILANLELVTSALAEQRGELAVMPGRVNESLGKLQETLELLADFSAEAKPELLTAAQNLRQTSDSLVNITGRVEHLLVENDAAIDSFLTDGVGETAALVTDARAAMRELEKLGTELRRNPSRVIYKPRLEPVVIAQ